MVVAKSLIVVLALLKQVEHLHASGDKQPSSVVTYKQWLEQFKSELSMSRKRINLIAGDHSMRETEIAHNILNLIENRIRERVHELAVSSPEKQACTSSIETGSNKFQTENKLSPALCVAGLVQTIKHVVASTSRNEITNILSQCQGDCDKAKLAKMLYQVELGVGSSELYKIVQLHSGVEQDVLVFGDAKSADLSELRAIEDSLQKYSLDLAEILEQVRLKIALSAKLKDNDLNEMNKAFALVRTILGTCYSRTLQNDIRRAIQLYQHTVVVFSDNLIGLARQAASRCVSEKQNQRLKSQSDKNSPRSNEEDVLKLLALTTSLPGLDDYQSSDLSEAASTLRFNFHSKPILIQVEYRKLKYVRGE